MKKSIAVAALMIASSAFAAGPTGKEFYVYTDAGSRENHYIPSGWMGSYSSLKLNPNWKVGAKSGQSCIQIQYDVAKDPETQWAGIYWQHPAQNWGNKKGGYDLTGFKRVTFWAKGQGSIDKFMIGGITAQVEEGDSAESYIERVELTPDWKQYTLDLKGLDLSHIIGGFGFAASADYNPKTIVMYLDDIRFEK